MISQQVIGCFETHKAKFPMLAETIEHIELYYKEKLWHNLTDHLLNYARDRAFNEGEDLIEMYNLMIKDLYGKINPLKYALITICVSRQFPNLEDSISFLEEARLRVENRKDASLMLKVAQGEKKLNLGLHHDCLELLSGVKKELEMQADIDAKVYASLSNAFAQYYRRKEDYENFYQSSMTYLAYTPPNELTYDEKKELSIKIGMAVMLGKNIYNISELLDKEVISSMKGTDFEWLYDMLVTLGQGKIQEFEAAIVKHSEIIQKFPNIVKELANLKSKVRIIAFLELLFSCDKDDRSLSFSRISSSCLLPQNEVELLVMKAMSLSLVRGTIDEVEQVAHVDWIMPRYLSQGHLVIMNDKLRAWEDRMDEVIKMAEEAQRRNAL